MHEEDTVRLRRAVLNLGRALRATSADEGLSPAQSSVLATLDREGPQRASALAAAEALNPTMLSRVVAHLEALDLVTRAPDPGDGRAQVLSATAGGRRLAQRLRRRRTALLGTHLEALPAEHAAALLAALPALEGLAASMTAARPGVPGAGPDPDPDGGPPAERPPASRTPEPAGAAR